MAFRLPRVIMAGETFDTGADMTPTAALPELSADIPPPTTGQAGQYPPLSEEARSLAEWYASDEFARQLLAGFEQARLAAIASNPPSPT